MDGGGLKDQEFAGLPTLADPNVQTGFDRDGYCVVPFLDEDRLDAVRAVYADLGRAPDDPGQAVHFGFFSEDARWKRRVREALRPIVEPVVEQLFASHRLVYAMFITKWPGDRSAFGPHRDPWFVDEGRFRSATLWCPLVDTPPAVGPDNGSLHFVPGSHRLTDTPRIHDASQLLFEGSQDLILDRYGLPARLRAGEAVVFDNGMIHYSYRNASAAPRTVLALGLVPRDAELFCLQPASSSSIRVFAIDTDYFIEHNPFSMAYGLGHYEEVALLPFEPPRLSEADFRSRCDEAISRMDPTLRHGPVPLPSADLSSDAFCFLCGGRDGLEDRPGPDHASVMMVCTGCADGVQDRNSGRTVPDPPADPDKPPLPLLGPRMHPGPSAAVDPLLLALRNQGFAIVPAEPSTDPAGLMAGVAARLGDPELVIRRLDGGGSSAAPQLAVAWSLVDEAAGERAWILWAPEGASGPAEIELVPRSHLVDPAPRGPRFVPAWVSDPALDRCARTVSVSPGEVLAVDPALAHHALTDLPSGVARAAIGVAVPSGAHPQHLRRLADGRVARYDVTRAWLGESPLYGDAALPGVCPATIYRAHAPRPTASEVLDHVAPTPGDGGPGGGARRRGGGLRRWVVARRGAARSSR